jgi:hypothetical protein
MIATLLIAALFAAPQEAPQEPPQRIRNVLLFGDEQCPKAEDPEEIVVCANAGDSPYRIPKRFREEQKTTGDSVSWSRRAEVVEEVNRVGLPNSCSPVGSGGQTGCTRAFIRQWAQERLEKQVQDSDVP